MLFCAFYLLLRSAGTWLRAVESMDQVGKVKLCVLCWGWCGYCLFGFVLTVLPHVSPKEGGRAARVPSLLSILPSARALFGVVWRPWVQWGGSGRIVCYGKRRQEKPNPCGNWGDRSAGAGGPATAQPCSLTLVTSLKLWEETKRRTEWAGELGAWLGFCFWVSQVERSFVVPLLFSVSLSFSTLRCCVSFLSSTRLSFPLLAFLFLIFHHYSNF